MHEVGTLNTAEQQRAAEALQAGHIIRAEATLETAMPLFERYNVQLLCVVAPDEENAPAHVAGALYRMDALLAYNDALASSAREYSS